VARQKKAHKPSTVELQLAFEREYPRERVLADPWKLPGGAYRETGGPT
jgi:hypothetical protein